MHDQPPSQQSAQPDQPTRRSIRKSLRLRTGPGRLSIHDPRRLDTTQLRAIKAPLRHETRAMEPLDVEGIAARAQGRGRPGLVVRRWLASALARPRLSWSSLAVPFVLFLGAVLATVNIGTRQDTESAEVRDLVSLAQSRSDKFAQAERVNQDLREQVAQILNRTPPGALPVQNEARSVAAGRAAVTGPGVRVQLWDAKVPDTGPGEFTNDDYVVHQGDIEAVLNALRAGGAEALAVQGHRIVSTTSIRCVGNVLYINGFHYSPPYVVEAIGEPAALTAALESSREVQIYRQYVQVLGLGWDLIPVDALSIAPHTGANVLLYAKVSE